MGREAGERKRFYQRNWFLWLSLFFMPPLGLGLLWLFHKEKRPATKALVSVLFSLWFALLVTPSKSAPVAPTLEALTPVQTAAAPSGPRPEPTISPPPSPTPSPAPETAVPTPEPTLPPETEPPMPSPTAEPSPKETSGEGSGKSLEAYDEPSQQNTTETYVLNKNTKKFHRPSCSSVKKIAAKNYATSSESRDALIAKGYSPCKNCKP